MVLGLNPGASTHQMTGPLQVTSPPHSVRMAVNGSRRAHEHTRHKSCREEPTPSAGNAPQRSEATQTPVTYARDEWTLLLSRCPQVTHSGW